MWMVWRRQRWWKVSFEDSVCLCVFCYPLDLFVRSPSIYLSLSLSLPVSLAYFGWWSKSCTMHANSYTLSQNPCERCLNYATIFHVFLHFECEMAISFGAMYLLRSSRILFNWIWGENNLHKFVIRGMPTYRLNNITMNFI